MALHSLVDGCGDDHHRWANIRSRRRRQTLANMQRRNDTISLLSAVSPPGESKKKKKKGRRDVLGNDSFSSGRSLGDNVGTFNHKRQNSCLDLVGWTDSMVFASVPNQKVI